MTDTEGYVLGLLAWWACWSLAKIAARAKSIADDMEALRQRAERGR
ncbi:MAG: hypothetical protein ACRYHC_01710 [Janthinobacterium lividum]